MNTKEGMTRMAKLVSLIGWAALVIGAFIVIAQPFSHSSESDGFVILISLAAFTVIQGVVWMLDGFMGTSSEQSSLLWPYKRSKTAQQPEPQIPAAAVIESTKGKHLRGVHGWLYLLVLNLIFFGPLLQLGSTIKNLADAERGIPNLLDIPGWEHYKAAAWTLTWISSAITFYAGYKLLRVHRPESVRLVIVLLWVVPIVVPVIDAYAANFYLHLPFNARSPEAGMELLRAILGATVITAYLKYSRRVRNTYYDVRSAATVQDKRDRVEPTL